MWNQADASATWEFAITGCEGSTVAGYTNWRLPDIKELQTIVDYTQSSPAIIGTLFPGTSSSRYWSSTTGSTTTNAKWINFSDGWIAEFGKGTSYSYRCVRTE